MTMNNNEQSPGWSALLRKLEAILSPEEWHSFAQFYTRIRSRYDGQDMSCLTLEELGELSKWATRAREET